MRRLRALVYGVGLVGLVAVLVPVWFVHDRVNRVLTSRRAGGSIDIDRVRADDISLEHVMSAGQPVIIEGLVEHLGLTGVATPDGLVDAVGERSVSVTDYDAATPYFLYSGGYDSTALSRRTMRVDELMHTMFAEGVAAETVVYQLFGVNSLDGGIADVLGRFDEAVRSEVDRPTEPRFSGVWVGSPGATTPIHHDAWPGLLFQTHGTKRVAMFSPADRTNLYFRTPLRGEGRWSDLPGRSADASATEFPRLGRATRHVGRLAPGDVLYIPPFWAHEMEALESNVSVPFRFAGPRTTYLNPGFLRPASEMLRKQVRVLTAR